MMGENKNEWESRGLERFGHLEDKIYRFVEAFKAIRKENAAFREEIQKLNSQLEDLRHNESGWHEAMAQLQKEREELRERVEKALSLLAALEEH
jgi:uncharacterized coiled-coil DUF342 family protein